MSQSPISPVGKRLRTMDAGSEDPDGDEPNVVVVRTSRQRSNQQFVDTNTNKNISDIICSNQRNIDKQVDMTTNDTIGRNNLNSNLSDSNKNINSTPKQEGQGSPLLNDGDLTKESRKSSQCLRAKIEPSTDPRSILEESQDTIQSSSSEDGQFVSGPDLNYESDNPRVLAEDQMSVQDYAISETPDHSDDRNDYMETLSNNPSEIYPSSVTDSDSDSSSGYIGYENAVAGRYYHDHEVDSLDLDSEEDEFEGVNHYSPEEYLQHDPTPDNPYPKPDWITLEELRARKCGFASSKRVTRRQNMYWFQRYASNSLWMIQRLQVVKKLQNHTSCVNCLDFSDSTDLLCSGSDDLNVCIWDWRKSKNQLKAQIFTGHTNNVFQSVFCNRDANIVTTSRDGSVRLIDVETSQNERLMSSTGEIGKIAFISPDTFLTCGTNANVNLIDLRTRDTRKLFTVRSPKSNRTCQLNTINSHPLDKHVIAVAGSSPYVFLYDLRRLPKELHDPEIKPIYNLGNLDNSTAIVTSTAFNSTGDKLLISYNDDDLYVCRTDTCEIIHKYQGHRNKKTMKGCAWFGDNFVLSGSDDGHIYGWDLESEHIVCFLHGDRGVVNTLRVHPFLPVLASSGLESDIKVWEPVSDTWPQTMKGIKPQICKNTMRRKRAHARLLGSRYIASNDEENEDDDDDVYNSDSDEHEGDDDEEDEDNYITVR